MFPEVVTVTFEIAFCAFRESGRITRHLRGLHAHHLDLIADLIENPDHHGTAGGQANGHKVPGAGIHTHRRLVGCRLPHSVQQVWRHLDYLGVVLLLRVGKPIHKNQSREGAHPGPRSGWTRGPLPAPPPGTYGLAPAPLPGLLQKHVAHPHSVVLWSRYPDP